MSEEIKDILDSLKFVIDNPTLEDEIGDKKVGIINYTELNAEESKQLLDYITNLQQKVEQLEKEKNTLMYSLTLVRQKWNNDKARYRRKAKVYREQRNQLESIRKEAIEYIKSYKNDYAPYELSDYNIREILNILNKGDNKE